MPKSFSEADMYAPVRDFFASMGYTVRGEVKDCDIAMQKDGALVVVELKKSFNITLLYQAVDRQKFTSQVYAAIPRPKRIKDRESALLRQILQKLGIGLIYVNMDGIIKSVEIAVFPPAVIKKGGKKQRDAVLKEIGERSIDLNAGGQTGKPLATAYREKAVKIACALEHSGALLPKELVSLYGCDRYSAAILRNNFYGWFEKAADRRYGLSGKGIAMLEGDYGPDGGAFAELVGLYRKRDGDLEK